MGEQAIILNDKSHPLRNKELHFLNAMELL